MSNLLHLALLGSCIICMVSSGPNTDTCNCGTSLLEAEEYSQELTSPDHPSNYCPNLTCRWEITAGKGHLVLLTILELNTEHSYDHLRIYDGLRDNRSQIAEVSGHFESLTQRVFISKQSAVHISFITDKWNSLGGFRLSFQKVTDCDCRTADLSAIESPKTLASPRYPWNYCSYLNCLYKISASDGHRIHVHIKDFDTERADYVTIYDGLSIATAHRIYAKSGTLKAHDVKDVWSAGRHMGINFVSDSQFQEKGFLLTYRSTAINCDCGPRHLIVTEHTQYLTSPGYPEPYCKELHCKYKMKTDGYQIRLKVLDLHTSTKDNLTVFEGASPIEKSVIAFLRGNADDLEERDIVINDSNLHIWFRSSIHKQAFRGFKLSYTAAGAPSLDKSFKRNSINSALLGSILIVTATLLFCCLLCGFLLFKKLRGRSHSQLTYPVHWNNSEVNVQCDFTSAPNDNQREEENSEKDEPGHGIANQGFNLCPPREDKALKPALPAPRKNKKSFKKDETSCSICMASKVDSSVPCGHLFCSGCLHKHLDENQGKGACFFGCPEKYTKGDLRKIYLP